MASFALTLTALAFASGAQAMSVTSTGPAPDVRGITQPDPPKYPKFILDDGPPTRNAPTSVEFWFHTISLPGKVQCKIDSEPYSYCESRKTYSGLSVGPHRAYFRTENLQGEKNPVVTEYPFTVGTPTGAGARLGKVTVKGPGKVMRGAKATYTLQVANTGDIAATGLKVKLSGGGVSLARKVGRVPAGGKKSVKLKARFDKAGRNRLTFRVSSANAGLKTVRKVVRVRR